MQQEDAPSQHEREPEELDDVPDHEQESVEDLFAFRRAAGEEDDDERDDAEDGDAEVEPVEGRLPKLLGTSRVSMCLDRDEQTRTFPKAVNRIATSRIIVLLTMISRM